LARILIGWELGKGSGYLQRAKTLAERLADRGHTPVLAMRDRKMAEAHFGETGWEVVQAPIPMGFRQPDGRFFRFTGYVDILFNHGFYVPDYLLPRVYAWEDIFRQHKIDAVVCEHSAQLTLAAHQRLPVLQWGTGYTVPAFKDGWFVKALSDEEPEVEQNQLLRGLALSFQARGDQPPKTLEEIWGGPNRFAYCFKDCDPIAHQPHRDPPARGPLEPLPDPAPLPDEPRVYAYLSPESPNFQVLAEALCVTRLPGAVFCPGCPPEQKKLFQEAELELRETSPLAPSVAEASLVVHHGGVDTAQIAYALGRPQFIAPRYLDQILMGESLVATGAAIRTERFLKNAETIGDAIRGMAYEGRFRDKAQAAARKAREEGPYPGYEGVADQLEGLF